MQTKWLDKNICYDGSQLRSLYAYMNEGILGDSIIAWRGPCDVAWEHMVDGEDLRARSPIAGSDMVHFVVEKFDCSLLAAVALQRLMSSIALDLIRQKAGSRSLAQELFRSGDDLFAGERKLSISVATVSPVSAMIHFAVNVSNTGTPVPTLSLEDLQYPATVFAQDLLLAMQKEVVSTVEATRKVSWIK